LPGALGSAQAGFAIFERQAKSDPGNALWQSDLAVSTTGVGDVQLAQNNIPAALGSYQAGLAIFDHLVKSDPGNTEWQRDLSVTYDSLAVVYAKSKQMPKARDGQPGHRR